MEEASGDGEEFVWEYGKVERNYTCATCQKLVKHFNLEAPHVALHEKLGYVRRYDDYWTLRLRDRKNGYSRTKPCISIEIIADSGCPNALGFSLLGCEINVLGIKRWIDQCDQQDAGRCHTIADPVGRIPDATGLYFIDVEKYCLVAQPQFGHSFRYAALSYVWGKSTDNTFQTLIENFDSLSETNAFKLPENYGRLPNTIKDSIFLTRALGIQYLWVDRFCIVQDDETAKPYQLAAMASIYSNSYVTIAATEGPHSNYGLCGIEKSRPRKPPFEILDFSPSRRMFAASPTRSTRDIYHSRGWTFQEWTFSRRMIVFHDQTVTWVCQKYMQQENGHTPFRVPARTPLTLWTKRPNPGSYCAEVEQYSSRNLSDPADVLAAFDAFITVQGRAMKGGMLYGLPELYFNNMLCWHHDFGSVQNRRRDREGNILKQFPSWSWAGWIGPTDMTLASEACHIVKSVSGLVYPYIVEFYKLPSSSIDGKREQIRNMNYYEVRGQTCIAQSDEELPEDEGTLCKYPVVEDDEIINHAPEQLYTTVIEFRSRRLFADIAKQDCREFSNDMALILGSEGQMIGALDLGVSFHSLDLPIKNIELVCISVSGAVCAKHAHIRSPGRQYIDGDGCHKECFVDEDHYYRNIYEPASNWQFRCYDVLWIEREDGIAYRRAIGQIWKEDWEAADTEEVDIRLG
ncbi:hypothetical protein ACJQWK_04107 [Exserohilum turcicum]